jgi:hypothetical protein
MPNESAVIRAVFAPVMLPSLVPETMKTQQTTTEQAVLVS